MRVSERVLYVRMEVLLTTCNISVEFTNLQSGDEGRMTLT